MVAIILTVIFTASFYILHKGIVDIKMFTRMPNQAHIRERYWYLLTDFTYLVMTVVMFLAMSYVSNYAGEHGLVGWYFMRALTIGMLIGDEGWDLLFGKVVDNDWFFPFPNWAFGWGFKTRQDRINFDIGRVTLAIILIGTYFIK